MRLEEKLKGLGIDMDKLLKVAFYMGLALGFITGILSILILQAL